jgi:hypothetical protein
MIRYRWSSINPSSLAEEKLPHLRKKAEHPEHPALPAHRGRRENLARKDRKVTPVPQVLPGRKVFLEFQAQPEQLDHRVSPGQRGHRALRGQQARPGRKELTAQASRSKVQWQMPPRFLLPAIPRGICGSRSTRDTAGCGDCQANGAMLARSKGRRELPALPEHPERKGQRERQARKERKAQMAQPARLERRDYKG